MVRTILAVSVIYVLLILQSCAQTLNTNNSIRLEQIATNLSSPVAMTVPNDGTNRIFIAEQGGIIKVIQNNQLKTKPLLNLKSKMVALNQFYDERGLLGIVCHPDFKTNRKFYVYYSAPSNVKGSNHKSVIAEYKISTTDPNIADLQERVLLTIEEPESNHNGGQLAFGPDGYLYIAVGDGGGAGDEHGTIGNGQNLTTLLGKILRIDVNSQLSSYKIPSDNPFIGKKNSKSEIWAYGLRNPWRFSFDRLNGKLFCADVGQDEYEEINIIEKGKNYGWRIMEASHCFNPEVNCNKSGLVLPINEYDHSIGKSITGGYVYRGSAIKELKGSYVFADWTGPMFSLKENATKWQRYELNIAGKPEDLRILSFGEDASGELYILTSQEVTPKSQTGSIYKIVPTKF